MSNVVAGLLLVDGTSHLLTQDQSGASTTVTAGVAAAVGAVDAPVKVASGLVAPSVAAGSGGVGAARPVGSAVTTTVFAEGADAVGAVPAPGLGLASVTPDPRPPRPIGSVDDCVLDRFEWIDPRDGSVWEWPGVHPSGVQGRGLPRPRLVADDLPGDGAFLREAWFDVRELVIPFAMQGWPAQLRAEWRAWAARLAAGSRGARPLVGTLRVTSVAGDRRQIGVVYSGGMELTESRNDLMIEAVQFRAFDPFWQDADETVLPFQPGVESAKFFPIPNPTTGSFITLTQGFIAVDTVIDNDGDVEAWPVITIVGPVTGVIAVNNTSTGESLRFTDRLQVGDWVTIDTRPGIKSVIGSDGLSRFASLSGTLWSLAPGENQVHVELGTVEAESSLEIRYRRRWLTA